MTGASRSWPKSCLRQNQVLACSVALCVCLITAAAAASSGCILKHGFCVGGCRSVRSNRTASNSACAAPRTSRRYAVARPRVYGASWWTGSSRPRRLSRHGKTWSCNTTLSTLPVRSVLLLLLSLSLSLSLSLLPLRARAHHHRHPRCATARINLGRPLLTRYAGMCPGVWPAGNCRIET